jgi:hypothetical protein
MVSKVAASSVTIPLGALDGARPGATPGNLDISPKVARALRRVADALNTNPEGGAALSAEPHKASSGLEFVSSSDLQTLLEAGAWDGTLRVSLPGVVYRTRVESVGASTHTGALFAPETAEYLVGDDLRSPTPLEKDAIVRAIIIETLGNINPFAGETREFSEQVLDSAFALARKEHADAEALLADPSAPELFRGHLSKILSEKDPEFGILTPRTGTVPGCCAHRIADPCLRRRRESAGGGAGSAPRRVPC